MSRILVVEDEIGLSGAIKEWLEDEMYVVSVVGDGLSALSEALSGKYELILLDWMLPGLDGISVCKRYRQEGGIAPVLILTAKTHFTAKEEGLDSGADDYLTKPFNMRELSARIRALLRRPLSAPKSVLQVGDLKLDRNTRTVSKNENSVRLLPKEFILLEVFMQHQGEVLSTEELIDHAWGPYSQISPETVRSQVKSLRKKIDTQGEASLITTVHAMGYKLESR